MRISGFWITVSQLHIFSLLQPGLPGICVSTISAFSIHGILASLVVPHYMFNTMLDIWIDANLLYHIRTHHPYVDDTFPQKSQVFIIGLIQLVCNLVSSIVHRRNCGHLQELSIKNLSCWVINSNSIEYLHQQPRYRPARSRRMQLLQQIWHFLAHRQPWDLCSVSIAELSDALAARAETLLTGWR